MIAVVNDKTMTDICPNLNIYKLRETDVLQSRFFLIQYSLYLKRFIFRLKVGELANFLWL